MTNLLITTALNQDRDREQCSPLFNLHELLPKVSEKKRVRRLLGIGQQLNIDRVDESVVIRCIF